MRRSRAFTSKGKRYLDLFKDDIPLPCAIVPYAQTVQQFHEWLGKQLVLMHTTEFEELRGLAEMLTEAYARAGISVDS